MTARRRGQVQAVVIIVDLVVRDNDTVAPDEEASIILKTAQQLKRDCGTVRLAALSQHDHLGQLGQLFGM